MSTFNVYNDVYREVLSSVLGNSSLCNRKHESDQNPEPAQSKGELWEKGLVQTAPINSIHTREGLSVWNGLSDR